MQRFGFLLRLYCILMILTHFFLSPLSGVLVYAQDSDLPEIESPLPLLDPTPLPSATPSEEPEGISPLEATTSSLITGDVEASAAALTTVNSVVSLPQQSSCVQEELSCTNQETINVQQTATISGQLESSASSGENSVKSATATAVLETGNATAAGNAISTINTSTIPSVSSGSLLEEKSFTPSPSTKGSVETEQKAVVISEEDVLANSGVNQLQNLSGSSLIHSGDAHAAANLIQLINTTVVDSDFRFVVFNLTDEHVGEINLNELWMDLQESKSNSGIRMIASSVDSNTLTLINSNNICLGSAVIVEANTGKNKASAMGDSFISSGDALAVGNSNTIANTTLLGSKFLFGILNIFSSKNQNIILPRPELFTGKKSLNTSDTSLSVQNTAQLQTSAFAQANSGENESTSNLGSNSTQTGETNSVANTINIVNSTMSGKDWFSLFVVDAGDWEGFVTDWSNSVSTINTGTTTYEAKTIDPLNSSDPEQLNTQRIEMETKNVASMSSSVQAIANTGKNSADSTSGSTRVRTGNARSIANLFSLINTTIIQSNVFLSFINIVGNWKGNVIFAYPDITVALTPTKSEIQPGEITEYIVTIENKGYDDARNVSVQIDLPNGLNYLGDNSGFQHTNTTNSHHWEIGEVKRNLHLSFLIQLQVNSDFSFEEQVSLFDRIIPKAVAIERQEKKVTLTAKIQTSDPQSNTDSDSSSTQTVVFKEFEPSIDTRKPTLVLKAVNNVNGFVFPGDVVTFNVDIKNVSDVDVFNGVLQQRLFTQEGKLIGTSSFKLGTIKSGKNGKLSFGLTVPKTGFPSNTRFVTAALVSGQSPDNTISKSNEANTLFAVRLKESLQQSLEAQAITLPKTGSVLGENTSSISVESNQPNLLALYVAAFFLSSFFFVKRARKLLQTA